jgi:hypothetical protein
MVEKDLAKDGDTGRIDLNSFAQQCAQATQYGRPFIQHVELRAAPSDGSVDGPVSILQGGHCGHTHDMLFVNTKFITMQQPYVCLRKRLIEVNSRTNASNSITFSFLHMEASTAVRDAPGRVVV